MALTNHLAQTLSGVPVLTVLLGNTDSIDRSAILLVVFAVWGLQFCGSQAWLSRFLFGRTR